MRAPLSSRMTSLRCSLMLPSLVTSGGRAGYQRPPGSGPGGAAGWAGEARVLLQRHVPLYSILPQVTVIIPCFERQQRGVCGEYPHVTVGSGP